MDKLKEYLLRHKTDLDVESPAGETWENIVSKMPDGSSRTGSWRRVVLYAAAACVIGLAGAGVWLAVGYKKPAADVAKHTDMAKHDGGAVIREPMPEKEKVDSTITMGEKIKPARRRARSQKPVAIPDEIDRSYSSLIDHQLRKLRAIPLYAENSQYFSFYIEQFKQMDRDERQVRNDIKVYGLTSELLEQLINVYQQKLTLLKNLQTEVNKMNNKVRERRSPTEKTEVHYLNI